MRLLEKHKKVSNKDIFLIADNLYNLHSSGLPITLIIELLSELPISKVYRLSLIDIRQKIDSGNSLSESFRYHNQIYPEFFTFLLSVGEETGRLLDVLFGLKMYYGRTYKMKKNLSQTLIYPIILLIAVIFLAIFLFVFIIPTFADIYVTLEKTLPTAMKVVLKINDYIKNNYIGSFLFIACWFVIIPYIIMFKVGKKFFITLFTKIKLFKEINEYFIVILLSIIIKSGINLNRGLEHCSTINNLKTVRNCFKSIKEDVLNGNTLYEAMDSCKDFSKYTLIHIRLGEDSGTLEERLIALEAELAENINSKIKKIMDMIGPLLIVFIGAIVLSFILTFILPLFSVM